MVAPVAAENLLCFGTHAVAVIYKMEIRFDFRQERQRFAVASPIAEQRQGFTDNIPGDIQSGTGLNGLCRQIFGLVGWFTSFSLGSKQGIEKAAPEQARRKRHQRPLAAEP